MHRCAALRQSLERELLSLLDVGRAGPSCRSGKRSRRTGREPTSTPGATMNQSTDLGLSALRDARLQIQEPRRSTSSHSTSASTGRQAIADRLRADLARTGFDLDEYRRLIRRSDAEARLRIAALRSEADQQSPTVRNDIARTTANLSDRVGH